MSHLLNKPSWVLTSRNAFVFFLQDKLPSHTFWAKRQSSWAGYGCYRIRVVVLQSLTRYFTRDSNWSATNLTKPFISTHPLHISTIKGNVFKPHRTHDDRRIGRCFWVLVLRECQILNCDTSTIAVVIFCFLKSSHLVFTVGFGRKNSRQHAFSCSEAYCHSL